MMHRDIRQPVLIDAGIMETGRHTIRQRRKQKLHLLMVDPHIPAGAKLY